MIADIEVTDVLQYTLADNTVPFRIVADELLVDAPLDHEVVDHYDLDVIATNAAGDSAVMSVPVDIIDLNESPQLITNEPLALIATATAVIDANYLTATDVDAADADGNTREYTLTSQPAQGELLLGGSTLVTGERFTQTEIDQGQLAYRHTGTAAANDAFSFTLTDGGEDGALPVAGSFDMDIHNPLAISIAPDWTLLEGGSMALSDPHLGRSGGLIDNTAVLLNVISLSPSFELYDTSVADTAGEFTYQDIVDGRLSLLHDGSELHEGELQLQWSRVDNGITTTMGTSTILLTALDVADAPGGSDIALATDHATALTINTAQLGFNDGDDGDSLTGIEIITVPEAGTLTVGGNPVNAGTIVNVAQLDNGEFQYVPDPLTAGVLQESISYRLLDSGDLTTGGQNRSANAYQINVTVVSDHIPQAQTDRIVVTEGETISSLSAGEVSVLHNDTDLDTDNNQLLVELVGGPLHGQLQLNRDGTFTYEHDGSETVDDSFSYRVVDHESELGQLLGSVGMVEIEIVPANDPPQAGDTEDQHVIANEPVAIDLPEDLFIDIDIDDELTITATRSDGSPLPEWLQFDKDTGTFTGVPDNNEAGKIQIVVTATDSAGASAQSEFELEVEPQIGAAFSVAVSPDSATNESATDSIVGEAPAAAALANPDSAANADTAEEAPLALPTADESNNLFAAFSERFNTPEFEDTVVKHERLREASTIAAPVIEHSEVKQAQVFDLQQLFFINSTDSSRLVNSIQQELNKVSGEMTNTSLQRNIALGGTITLTTGLSIGYVLWLIRGGLLLTSVLTSMPAWRLIDPIPVLEDQARADGETDDETLESIADAQDADNDVEAKDQERTDSYQKNSPPGSPAQ
ncbi:MAG: cadherin-like domain-containing protein [Pseudomonadota bacterium]